MSESLQTTVDQPPAVTPQEFARQALANDYVGKLFTIANYHGAVTKGESFNKPSAETLKIVEEYLNKILPEIRDKNQAPQP